MPSSSISISPTPDSWTILTSSRIRSPRWASTSPPSSDASREWRCADGLQERLGLLAEHREQHELLLASRRAPRPPRGRPRRSAGRPRAPAPRRRAARPPARTVGVDRARAASPYPPVTSCAELVEDRAVAARREHVEQRLRAEDLADRRRERRPAGLLADAHDLVERRRAADRRRRARGGGRRAPRRGRPGGRTRPRARRSAARAGRPARRRCARRRRRRPPRAARRRRRSRGRGPRAPRRATRRRSRCSVERERVDGRGDEVGADAASRRARTRAPFRPRPGRRGRRAGRSPP